MWAAKRVTLVVWGLIVLAGFGMGWCEDERVTVHPEDVGAALENPGMGWVFHHYDNNIRGYGPPLGDSYAGNGFPGLTTAYFRLAWSYLEPEEGVFDWSVVDEPAQRYIANGKKIAFCFTCSESHQDQTYATPRWVAEAGAQGHWFTWEDGPVDDPSTPDARWQPDFGDPVFLEKLDHFLAAAAARYDGEANVAFIDMGTFGLWGEGHSAWPYPSDTIRKHIDLHRKHFKKTLLVGNDDWTGFHSSDALHRPGRRDGALSFRITEAHWGQSYAVWAGIWAPEETKVVSKYLTPKAGDAQERVRLGVLCVDNDGAVTFKAEPRPGWPGPDGDFDVMATGFQRRGPYWTILCRWQIHRDLQEGVRGFCRLLSDGERVLDGWQAAARPDALDYARSYGMTLRDNSILWRGGDFAFINDWMAEDFWPYRAVIIEIDHYVLARDRGTWEDGSKYLEALERYHASYVSIHSDPDQFLRENAVLIEAMNRRIGYRVQLVEASWPKQVRWGGVLYWDARWRNGGVAPCYAGGVPALTLRDQSGDAAAKLVDGGFNVRTLPVGPPETAQTLRQQKAFSLPESLPEGVYEVYISVEAPMDGVRLALPLSGGDGTRHYRLGTIRVAR